MQESREAGGGADRAGVAGEFDHCGPAAAPPGLPLQSPRKRQEGATHPDRNAQFEHINQTADEHLTAGQPVISVDTKKKELVGNFKNGGREWQPKGTPPAVLVHDFQTDAEGKAIPYGVYDMARNEGARRHPADPLGDHQDRGRRDVHEVLAPHLSAAAARRRRSRRGRRTDGWLHRSPASSEP